jgi:hypothetical protein
MAHASSAARNIIAEVLMLSFCRILAAQLPTLAEEERSMYDFTHLRIQYIMMAIALENGLPAEEVFVPPQSSPSLYTTVLAISPLKKYHSSSLMELSAQILLSNIVGAPPLPQKKCAYRATVVMTPHAMQLQQDAPDNPKAIA